MVEDNQIAEARARALAHEEEQFNVTVRRLRHLNDPKDLCDAAYSALEMMLRRESDKDLLTRLSQSIGEIIGAIPFGEAPDRVQLATFNAVQACVAILQKAKNERPSREEDLLVDAANADVEYYLPPHLAHLIKNIEYEAPEMPPPQSGFSSFERLCEAAILYRMDKVLVFFQRKNPAIVREVPPPYLFSPEFGVKLKEFVRIEIFPALSNSRQIRVLSVSSDWSQVDADSFWDNVNPQLKTKIMGAWKIAWEMVKLIPGTGEDGQPVLKVKDSMKMLRATLQPSSPEAYDLPHIGNLEVDIFASLLDLTCDWWEKLSDIWRRCYQLYEQEKDPRVFQQQAREGALRDSLLAAFGQFPQQWGDFLVLCCHRIFPRIDSIFLERFSMSLGKNAAERERAMPILMRYLEQVQQRPDIRVREQRESEEWTRQTQQLRVFLSGRKG